MAAKLKVKKAEPCGDGNHTHEEPLERIGEYEADVPLRLLKYYYENPRIGNVEKVAESIKENGQFKPIVVNRGTLTGRANEILAGNHTAKAARSLGWKNINVTWVDVTEEHARRIVLADNGSTDDATYDVQVLAKLLDDQKNSVGHLVGTTYSDEVLGKLLVEVNTDPMASIDKIEDAPGDLDGVQDLNKYVFFQSDKDFDIPELRLEMIPPRLPEKLDIWAGIEIDGSRAKDEDQWWLAQWHTGNRGIPFDRSILSLYTEDFHFEGLFYDPAMNTKKIMNVGITTCIMPNFSVNQDWPIYTWIWAAARSAFVGRYWQEAGLYVIPDIQYGGSDEALDLCLQCIPEGAPVVSAQVQTLRGDPDRIRATARLLKKAEERIGFDQILVYGHTDADKVVQYAGFNAEVVRVSNRTARRREILDGQETFGKKQVRSKKPRRSDDD